MPLYDYLCVQCGKEQEVVLAIRDLNAPIICEHCQTTMKRIISTVNIAMDYPGYSCPITGKWIEGKRAHRENLAKHGRRVLEPGEREEFQKNRAREEEALCERVAETAARTVANWPAEKQAKLGEELAKGADVVIERR